MRWECIQKSSLEETGFGYTLSLIPILDAMCMWGYELQPKDSAESVKMMES